MVQDNDIILVIPSAHINSLQRKNIKDMLTTISHGGMIDIEARIDGRNYKWEADYLSHVITKEQPNDD